MNDVKRACEFLHRTGYVVCQIVSQSSAGSAVNNKASVQGATWKDLVR